MYEGRLVSKHRWTLVVFLFLAVALVVSCGGDDGEPSPAAPQDGQAAPSGPVPTVTGTTAMAVDAISGGPVDATRTVTGTATFDVDIVIMNVDPEYQGYQYWLIWDPEVLALDGQADLEPDSLDMCAAPATTENRVAAGCLRTAGPTTFAGPVNTATFHCVGDGTSQLHLLTSEEEASFTTTLLWDGRVIDTALTDASVTCEGAEGLRGSRSSSGVRAASVQGGF